MYKRVSLSKATHGQAEFDDVPRSAGCEFNRACSHVVVAHHLVSAEDCEGNHRSPWCQGEDSMQSVQGGIHSAAISEGRRCPNVCILQTR